MNLLALLAAVIVHVPYFNDVPATIDGCAFDISIYRPGWEGGVPKDTCKIERKWSVDGNGIGCEYRVKFLKPIELQCIAPSLHVGFEGIAGRECSAETKTWRVPEKFSSIGLASGTAKSFSLPMSDGQTLVAEFPESVRFVAQDGRKWGKTWFLRFGPDMGGKTYSAGEELAYRVRFTSPDGIELKKDEPRAIAAGDQWAVIENRKDIVPGSALDFSHMGLQEAPAGKFGWLRSVGDHFEFTDSPGVERRFYGVNLCFSANYPTHEEADLIVARFVALGYNTIRVHHHDGIWATKPEDREKLDYLLARAIEHGLYITTDLYVSRRVSWKELGEEGKDGPAVQLFKALVTVDDRAYANWLSFSREFLEHVNPYTKRAYKDEPGMPFISLINEGGITMGFNDCGKATDPRMIAAWREYAKDPTAATVPSPYRDSRVREFGEELNRRFMIKAKDDLRKLGVKALLTNDNNGGVHGEGEGVTPLYDYVDNHFYVDHPQFIEKKWRLPSRCPNENPIRVGQPKMFSRGYAKEASKPYAISEWNFSGPGRYRALGGILTGAFAIRDRWDAIWRFGYAHDRKNLTDGPDQSPGYFDCATDPLQQAGDRASVCLFLRGDALKGIIDTDASKGSMSFVSPLTCGGFVEGGKLEAGALTARVTGAAAAIWVSSLDGKSVVESDRLLVAHLTDVQGEGTVYADEARKILLKWGKGCLIEKGEAVVTIKHDGPVSVWALDTTGRRVKRVEARENADGIEFVCSTADGTIYYELVK